MDTLAPSLRTQAAFPGKRRHALELTLGRECCVMKNIPHLSDHP